MSNLAQVWILSPRDTNPLTSFSEYRDLATMSSSFFVSAWNSCLEKSPAGVRGRAGVKSSIDQYSGKNTVCVFYGTLHRL